MKQRNRIAPRHAIFGDGYRKLEDDDTLQPGDETTCVSTMLSLNGDAWICVDKTWDDLIGLTIAQVCDDHGDADGAERIFRRKLPHG